MALVMYVKPGCPWCEEQRSRFRAQGVEWAEIDAKADPEARAELIRLTGGSRKVPTVVEDGVVVSVGVDGYG
ncbi:MAG: Uxx-star family glutaredoxin-like (seleno)protein [Gaiellales bacterium]